MRPSTFLSVAAAAEELLGSPEVAERWDEPSALEGYSVGGLAGHLARAVLTVQRYLEQPAPDPEAARTDAAGYLVRVLGDHDPVTSPFHGKVRERGEEEAAGGPAALVERYRAARQELDAHLPEEPTARAVTVLDGVVLPLGEYLETRLVELVVHLDDLAVSLGMDGPPGVSDEAFEAVAVVLSRVAARRVGSLATVRSLARRERQPDPVRAL